MIDIVDSISKELKENIEKQIEKSIIYKEEEKIYIINEEKNNIKTNIENIKIFKDTKNYSNDILTFVDLFCGLGGFHIAINNILGNKSKCIMSCDINKKVKEVYK